MTGGKRTYCFYKIGVKYENETEFSIFNEPYLNIDKAEHEASRLCMLGGRETAVFEFRMLMKFKP